MHIFKCFFLKNFTGEHPPGTPRMEFVTLQPFYLIFHPFPPPDFAGTATVVDWDFHANFKKKFAEFKLNILVA